MAATKSYKHQPYRGFEQGPIRPPSEAASLLIRVTRNCPWNRCTFCPVYKGEKFSLRPVEHVIADIDRVHHFITLLHEKDQSPFNRTTLNELAENLDNGDRMALSAAINWIRSGMRWVFLQDANSLVIKPDDLIAILKHLKTCFPRIERITSYARSHTICRIKVEKLVEMRKTGLNRIHIGMESGSDKVLAKVKKGSTQRDHIEAGVKVKKAGMELSEYVMPGLGGKALSKEHALDTAEALNAINADFIRLRSLAIPNHVELHESYINGEFSRLSDNEVAEEILVFLKALNNITSTLKSDHILNLFEEIEGTFPQDKEKMVAIVSRYLQLSPHEQMLYQVGRRTGIFRSLSDLDNSDKRRMAQSNCDQFGITPDNVNGAIEELMKRFI